jgi:hypothetical protein
MIGFSGQSANPFGQSVAIDWLKVNITARQIWQLIMLGA